LSIAWALIMFMVGAWLLPAAESYRYSRGVAERLASLSASHRATPMLASFQEPSVIYAMGKPVALMRNRADLVERVQNGGTVVSALLAEEEAVLRTDPLLRIDVPDELRVFNINKGKSETLRFTLIRARALALAGDRVVSDEW
ncbi:MAG TPA: hypothetical protein VGY53_04045, partial [Isosphaeraceae bacterium]|nr:hypothetical protein [Isosphaeraceae bacterium]